MSNARQTGRTETHWEYTTAADSIVDQIPGSLNYLGLTGWEVVGVVPHPTNPDVVRCLLKRPVNENRAEDPNPWMTRQAESTRHVPSPDEPAYDTPAWASWRAKYEQAHGVAAQDKGVPL